MYGVNISGYQLKVIAVISMLIDHIGATVVYGLLMASYSIVSGENGGMVPRELAVWVVENWDLAVSVYSIMRIIGRIAFPIYCFLIVEGFLHTKNVRKYALRLGIFSILSEIPFDLAFNDGWFDKSSNNVFFTLWIGLLVIWGISYLERWCGLSDAPLSEQNIQLSGNGKRTAIGKIICAVLVGGVLLGAGCILANRLLCTDYGAAGVVTIVLMYLFRKKTWQGFVIAVVVLTLMTNSPELYALFGAVLVCYYNGERGKNIKYFFYAFYPVHLLLLWLVTYILGV